MIDIQDGHTCESPVSVAVDGTGIPVIDDGVTVYERKDGHMSVNRRADVHFPLVTNETEWVNKIDAFRDEGEIQIVDIGMTGLKEGDSEHHMMRGYINGVGSRGGVNVGRFRVLGPFKLLSSIPAGKSVDADMPINAALLEWFASRFESAQPIFDSVTLDSAFDNNTLIEDFTGTPGQSSIGRNKVLRLSANRDTLADASKKMINEVGLFMSFEPDPDNSTGIVLTVKPMSDVEKSNFDLTEGGDVRVIENDALYEMRPFNGVVVKGKGGTYVDLSGSTHYDNLGDISDAMFGDGSYPEATAVYPPLVERAGGEIKQTINSNKSATPATEREARSKLKSMLDEVSGGSILTELEPRISLYHTLTATPACAGIFDEAPPELTYEVQRVEHTVAPNNDGNNIPSSTLSVSMEIDPSKIETRATRKDTQPSRDSNNEPPESDPSEGVNWGWS